MLPKNRAGKRRGSTLNNVSAAGIVEELPSELLGVKSPSEFIELSTAQMRKQFDVVSAQNRELCALAQEVATEAAESIKTGVSEAFNTAR